MKLTDILSGSRLAAAINALSQKDYATLNRHKGFTFNWKLEQEKEVYKIYLLANDQDILGVMSLIDHPNELRIHLNLLEVALEHRGQSKKIDLIAGCLIAFAASLALKRGYYGFVSLEPKTMLVDHYQRKYGFRQFGRYLAIEDPISQILVNKYLLDHEEE